MKFRLARLGNGNWKGSGFFAGGNFVRKESGQNSIFFVIRIL